MRREPGDVMTARAVTTGPARSGGLAALGLLSGTAVSARVSIAHARLGGLLGEQRCQGLERSGLQALGAPQGARGGRSLGTPPPASRRAQHPQRWELSVLHVEASGCRLSLPSGSLLVWLRHCSPLWHNPLGRLLFCCFFLPSVNKTSSRGNDF